MKARKVKTVIENEDFMNEYTITSKEIVDDIKNSINILIDGNDMIALAILKKHITDSIYKVNHRD